MPSVCMLFDLLRGLVADGGDGIFAATEGAKNFHLAALFVVVKISKTNKLEMIQSMNKISWW